MTKTMSIKKKFTHKNKMGLIWNVWRQTTPFFLPGITNFLLAIVHHLLAFIVAYVKMFIFFFFCRVLVSKLVSQTIQVVNLIRSLVSALMALFIFVQLWLARGVHFFLLEMSTTTTSCQYYSRPLPINLKILNAVFSKVSAPYLKN